MGFPTPVRTGIRFKGFFSALQHRKAPLAEIDVAVN